VPDRVRENIQEIAVRAFQLSECSGLARVDFFIEGERVLLNELNTMPGFTSTSVFAALFEASGVSYAELLDRLVQLAFERHETAAGVRH
jgi:D-alanine-D-alanine ligase